MSADLLSRFQCPISEIGQNIHRLKCRACKAKNSQIFMPPVIRCRTCDRIREASGDLLKKLGGTVQITANIARLKCATCKMRNFEVMDLGMREAPAPPTPSRTSKLPSSGWKPRSRWTKSGNSSKSKWTDRPAGNTVWENKESKAAAEYSRGASTGDFVRAQKARLRDLGMD